MLLCCIMTHFLSEIPSSPTHLTILDEEYYANFSSIVLLWNTTDGMWVDYFNLLVEVEGVPVTKHYYRRNETMAIISNLPYNVNITFLLTAHNCIGESIPVNIEYNTGNNLKAYQ